MVLLSQLYVLDGNGLIPALSKMAFGNKMGFSICSDIKEEALFAPSYGCIVAEVDTSNFRN